MGGDQRVTADWVLKDRGTQLIGEDVAYVLPSCSLVCKERWARCSTHRIIKSSQKRVSSRFMHNFCRLFPIAFSLLNVPIDCFGCVFNHSNHFDLWQIPKILSPCLCQGLFNNMMQFEHILTTFLLFRGSYHLPRLTPCLVGVVFVKNQEIDRFAQGLGKWLKVGCFFPLKPFLYHFPGKHSVP